MPSTGAATPFVIKLYDLVAQPETDGIVCWGLTGDSFVVLDISLLQQVVLPMYFKHNGMRSFERQLNIYGFQRCLAQPTARALEFFHPKFKRGDRESLLEIKRRQQASKQPRPEVDPEEEEMSDLSDGSLSGIGLLAADALLLAADIAHNMTLTALNVRENDLGEEGRAALKSAAAGRAAGVPLRLEMN